MLVSWCATYEFVCRKAARHGYGVRERPHFRLVKMADCLENNKVQTIAL